MPCAPATIARTGPGLAPCTTDTAMFVAASTPAGTAITPVAFCPLAAAAVPTFSVGRGSEAVCAAGLTCVLTTAAMSATASDTARRGCFIGGFYTLRALPAQLTEHAVS